MGSLLLQLTFESRKKNKTKNLKKFFESNWLKQVKLKQTNAKGIETHDYDVK